jgi:hypothetical protein
VLLAVLHAYPGGASDSTRLTRTKTLGTSRITPQLAPASTGWLALHPAALHFLDQYAACHRLDTRSINERIMGSGRRHHHPGEPVIERAFRQVAYCFGRDIEGVGAWVMPRLGDFYGAGRAMLGVPRTYFGPAS